MTDALTPFLAEAIRKASKEGKLIDNRELASAGSRYLNAALSPEAAVRLLESAADSEYTDIRRLEGNSCSRWYSSLSMADSYASTLNSLADGNEYEIIALAVRRESRLYPRPTRVELFLRAPYMMKPEQLQILTESIVEADGDYADIQRTEASNGDVYLYSTRFLDKPQADYLSEWESVDQLECQ
jgi:hypothetical protein